VTAQDKLSSSTGPNILVLVSPASFATTVCRKIAHVYAKSQQALSTTIPPFLGVCQWSLDVSCAINCTVPVEMSVPKYVRDGSQLFYALCKQLAANCFSQVWLVQHPFLGKKGLRTTTPLFMRQRDASFEIWAVKQLNSSSCIDQSSMTSAVTLTIAGLHDCCCDRDLAWHDCWPVGRTRNAEGSSRPCTGPAILLSKNCH